VSGDKNAASKTTIIRGARLIDGNGGDPIRDAVIVVEDKKIKALGKKGAVTEPAGAEVIDAHDCTLMPGMFDCHLHVAAYNVVTFQNFRAAIFETSPQLEMLYALFHAQLCFEQGFTTLRDMGRFTPFDGRFTFEICAIRDAIELGIVPGPRLVTSGRAVITGSHLDLVLPRSAKRPPNMTADGPWELRRMVREELRIGADWIKTCASGGGGTSNEEPDIRNMTQEELNAIVDEAHAFHKPVAVHCFTPMSQRMCLEAGVDTIEHMVFSDAETTKLIAEAGIAMTPTLAHRTDHAIEIRRKVRTPENTIAKMKKIQPHAFDTFKRFHQAGIKIIMGTDTGLDPEMGHNAMELEVYVMLGMTPMEAIQTATKNAAEALRLPETGTLEVGKLADLIAVRGDPLHDITVLQPRENIRVVMKEGRAFVDKVSPDRRYVLDAKNPTWKIADTL
jgi:imidazolonepropionase-like amidohydrolase